MSGILAAFRWWSVWSEHECHTRLNMSTTSSTRAPSADVTIEEIANITRDALSKEIPSTWTSEDRWKFFTDNLESGSGLILEGFIRVGAIKRLHAMLMKFPGSRVPGTPDPDWVSLPIQQRLQGSYNRSNVG